jgi:hypothetical protein
VFKLPGDVVQVDPSYSSVAPVIVVPPPPESPPKAKAAVCIPAPVSTCLAVFKPVGFDAQEVPSYSSVAVCNVSVAGTFPPKAKSCCLSSATS